MLQEPSDIQLSDFHLPESLDRFVGKFLMKFSLEGDNLVLTYCNDETSPDVLRIPLSQFTPDTFSESLEAIISLFNNINEQKKPDGIYRFYMEENLIRDGLRNLGLIIDSAKWDDDNFYIYEERFDISDEAYINIRTGDSYIFKILSYNIVFYIDGENWVDKEDPEAINVFTADLTLIRSVIRPVVNEAIDHGYDIYKVREMLVQKFQELGLVRDTVES